MVWGAILGRGIGTVRASRATCLQRGEDGQGRTRRGLQGRPARPRHLSAGAGGPRTCCQVWLAGVLARDGPIHQCRGVLFCRCVAGKVERPGWGRSQRGGGITDSSMDEPRIPAERAAVCRRHARSASARRFGALQWHDRATGTDDVAGSDLVSGRVKHRCHGDALRPPARGIDSRLAAHLQDC